MAGRRQANRAKPPRTIRVDRLERMRLEKAQRLRVERVKPEDPRRKATKPRP